MKKKLWPVALALLLFGGSADAAFTLQIDGKKDLEAEADVVLPLRTVAEALGFKVFWDNGQTFVEKDNLTMSLIVGDTRYIITRTEKDGSVTDLSMYLPAPYLRNNETYVPAVAFTYMLEDGQKLVSSGTALVVGGEGVIDESDEDYKKYMKENKKEEIKESEPEETVISEPEESASEGDILWFDESAAEEDTESITWENVPSDEALAESAPAESVGAIHAKSEFENYSTLREASDAAGVTLSLPNVGTRYDSVAYRAVPGQVLEVIYGSEGREALRLRKGTGRRDVSGDYSSYATVKTIKVDDINVRMKGNGSLMRLATWERGGHAYAAIARAPLTIAEMMAIVRETV